MPEPARSVPNDPKWERAWREELHRRLAELRRGEVEALPWDEVRERLKAMAPR
jgi:putative addiction module component (TIGR02574 family)